MISSPWFRQIFLLFSCLVFFGLAAMWLGQDVNWDVRNYHYYNGYAFLHHRMGYDIAPALMQSYLNPFLDVLNYYLIDIQKPRATEFLLGIFSGLICYFVVNIANLLFAAYSFWQRRLCVIFSVVIGMTGAMGVSLIGMTTNDVPMSLLIVIALYCLLKSGRGGLRPHTASERRQIAYIMASGFIIGADVGLKLTAVCYAIGLFAGLWFSHDRNRKHRVLCAVFLVCALLGFVLVNGYWMYFLYQQFQSPLFPYYNHIFHSPYAPYMSFNLSPTAVVVRAWHYLLLPFYMAFEKNMYFSERLLRDPRLAIVWILSFIWMLKTGTAGFAIARKSVMSSAWRLMLVYCVVSYVIWVVMFSVYRYVLPLELMTGILIVYLARQVILSDRLLQVCLITLTAICFVTTYYPSWGRIKSGNDYFAMSVPPLPPHAVVMLLAQPLAYVAPFFSSDVRFIGMPFVVLGEKTTSPYSVLSSHRNMLMKVMQQLGQPKIKVPLYTLTLQKSGINDGDMMFLVNRNNTRILAILAKFGIEQDRQHCVTFETNIKDVMELCSLRQRFSLF